MHVGQQGERRRRIDGSGRLNRLGRRPLVLAVRQQAANVGSERRRPIDFAPQRAFRSGSGTVATAALRSSNAASSVAKQAPIGEGMGPIVARVR